MAAAKMSRAHHLLHHRDCHAAVELLGLVGAGRRRVGVRVDAAGQVEAVCARRVA